MISNKFTVWRNGAPVMIMGADGSFGTFKSGAFNVDQVSGDPTFTPVSFSSKRLALVAFTTGMDATEAQDFYNLIRQLRQDMEHVQQYVTDRAGQGVATGSGEYA